jgi:uncharacterized membrane protein YozB (DUF420 family)
MKQRKNHKAPLDRIPLVIFLALLVLFPLRFLYNAVFVLTGYGGWVGGGGLFSLVIVFIACLLYSGHLFLRYNHALAFSYAQLLYASSFLLLLVLILSRFLMAWMVFGEIPNAYIGEYFYMLFGLCTFFALGAYSISTMRANTLLIILYIVLLLYVIYMHNPETGRINYRFISASSSMVTHHFYVIAYLGTGWMALSTYKLKGIPLFLLICSLIFGVYLIGSRGELVSLMTVILFIYSLKAIKKMNQKFHRRYLFYAASTLLLFFVIVLTHDMTPRMTEMISGKAVSFDERRFLMFNAINDITNNVLWGKTGGQLAHGEFGSYAHNLLSVWRQFGIFPFVLYFSLSALSLAVGIKRIIQKNTGPDRTFVIGALMFIVICVIVSKSVFWPLIAMAWGITFSLMAPSRADCNYYKAISKSEIHDSSL